MYFVYTKQKFIYKRNNSTNMIRKLIKHGESSLTVSLPRKYVKENNLIKGQEIELTESGKEIIISIKKKKKKKQKV